jgi:hypothetical protein
VGTLPERPRCHACLLAEQAGEVVGIGESTLIGDGFHGQPAVEQQLLGPVKAAIRREMERLQPLVRAGGFIPGVDHRVQADVKLENYKYYLKLKRELLGVGGTPQYDESAIG